MEQCRFTAFFCRRVHAKHKITLQPDFYSMIISRVFFLISALQLKWKAKLEKMLWKRRKTSIDSERNCHGNSWTDFQNDLHTLNEKQNKKSWMNMFCIEAIWSLSFVAHRCDTIVIAKWLLFASFCPKRKKKSFIDFPLTQYNSSIINCVRLNWMQPILKIV